MPIRSDDSASQQAEHRACATGIEAAVHIDNLALDTIDQDCPTAQLIRIRRAHR